MATQRRIPVSLLVVTLLAAACSSSTTTEVQSATEEPTTAVSTITTTTASTSTTAHRPASDSLVVFIGDSITVQATGALLTSAAGAVEILAADDARSIDLVGDAPRLADREPDVVVVNLGTNDEACATVGGCSDGYDPTADDLADSLRRIVGLFPRSCRIGVTITYRGNDPAMVNPALDVMVDDGTLDSIADWSRHRDRSEPDDDPWVEDFLGHLTTSGAHALTDLVNAEVARTCFGPSGSGP